MAAPPEDPNLPKPWKGLWDDTTGHLYYWNTETNQTQWEKPIPAVPGKEKEDKTRSGSRISKAGTSGPINSNNDASLGSSARGPPSSAAGNDLSAEACSRRQEITVSDLRLTGDFKQHLFVKRYKVKQAIDFYTKVFGAIVIKSSAENPPFHAELVIAGTIFSISEISGEISMTKSAKFETLVETHDVEAVIIEAEACGAQKVGELFSMVL